MNKLCFGNKGCYNCINRINTLVIWPSVSLSFTKFRKLTLAKKELFTVDFI